MPTHYPDSAFMGDEGVAATALVCARAKSFFRAWPSQDIGIDGSIEFCNEKGESTGAIALIQCKAGLSFISSGKHYIKTNKAHFETWLKYKLPVIGIVYNPQSQDARWVNISEYLLTNLECVESGPYVIEAPANNPFSEEGFHKLQEAIERVYDQLEPQSVGQLIDDYLTTRMRVRKEEILTVLFARFRFKPSVCFFLHRVIRTENDPFIVKYLIYLLCAYWFPQKYGRFSAAAPASMPHKLRLLASKYLADFDTVEIEKLLRLMGSTIGSLYDRGILPGLDDFFNLFDIITNGDSKLCQIAANHQIKDITRDYALTVLMMRHLDDREFYEKLITEDQSPAIVKFARRELNSLDRKLAPTQTRMEEFFKSPI